MKRIAAIWLVLASFGFAASVSAVESLVESVANGCEKELVGYCSEVTPGEGRILACLYAHEDKLSGQCQYALYNASAQLEHAVSALNYVAGQCQNDIEKLCAKVQMGEGRIAQCLENNAESVSPACKQAMNDVFE